jgi:hypothetical protein
LEKANPRYDVAGTTEVSGVWIKADLQNDGSATNNGDHSYSQIGAKPWKKSSLTYL